MTEPKAHPSTEELAAFSLGQLAEEEASKVESHVRLCDPCCETMAGLSAGDTFVELLQQADKVSSGDVATSDESKSAVDMAEPVGAIPRPLATHPRYEILELIGHGGMGRVYKAKHRMMGRMVALKVINQAWVGRPEAIERFHREVQTAASLDHANIVTAYDAEQAGDLHFLAMEYVDGVNLAETVDNRGPLPIDEACNYIRQAAIGLEYAHQRGMVHRDIKPHNLMVTQDSTLKILDFGLASLVRSVTNFEEDEDAPSHLTVAGSIMGTPDFISPEQAQDARQADIRSDIYSLGMTFYHLLAGRLPFPDGNAVAKIKSHADAEPTPLSTLRADVTEELCAVIGTMAAKNPSDRFQSPIEVADALLPFVSSSDGQVTVSEPVALPGPVRFPFVWIAAVALLLIGGGIGVLQWNRVRPAQIAAGPPAVEGQTKEKENADEGQGVATTPAQQVKNDLENLQGTWKVTYVEDSGRLPQPEALQRMRAIRFEFLANMMKTEVAGRKEVSTFKLDPSRSPKSIDMKFGGRAKSGIYDLQGDTLRLSFAESSDERPTAFDSQPDSTNEVMLMLKRVRPGDTDTNSGSKELDHSGPLTEEIAISLIPKAASISNQDFLKLAKSPKPIVLENKSLSFVLLMLSNFEGDLKRDFQYLVQEVIKPSRIAEAMVHSQPQGYVSMIQPSYITECMVWEAEEGEPTKGFVSFNAPQLYLGSVLFEASRHEGKWRIEKFSLVAHKTSVVLGKDGIWTRVDNDPEISEPTQLEEVSATALIVSLNQLDQMLNQAKDKKGIASPEVKELAERLQMQLQRLIEPKPYASEDPTEKQIVQISSCLQKITKSAAAITPTRSSNQVLRELNKLTEMRTLVEAEIRAMKSVSTPH